MEPHLVGSDWTAVVLAGGRSTRFGSDKLAARLRGRRLIDLVLERIRSDAPVIVVGPDLRPVGRSIRVVREQPAHGGPVAALAAALPLIQTPIAVVIAADMPSAAAFLDELVRDLPEDADGRVPIDGSDRLQVLCGAYRVAALQEAILLAGNGKPQGLSMQAVVGRLRISTVAWPAERTWDVDTPADLDLGEHILAVESDDGVPDQDREAGDGQG